MKKQYLLIVMVVAFLGISFSGCYYERDAAYRPYHSYHHHHYYSHY